MSSPPTLTSHKSKEHFPLYTPSSSSSDNLIQPDAHASPDAVREYITSLLITKRSLPSDHAQRIASKWTVGQGRDLQSYPAAMYLSIFGREDGWMVCREVKLRLYQAEEESKDAGSKIGERQSRLVFPPS